MLTTPATVAAQGVCDRTPLVRDTLVRVAGVLTCGEVTVQHLVEIRALDLSNFLNRGFQAHDFRGMHRLERLDLSYNAVRDLPEGIFDRLRRLKHLDLSENSLRTLPQGIFRSLGNLEVLNLHGNGLRSLPDRTLSNLGKLTELRLEFGGLTDFPQGIFSSLTSLKHLELISHYPHTDFPRGVLDGLSSLEHLVLASSPTTASLPEGIFDQLSNLKHLELFVRLQTSLSKDIFSQLDNLKHLELSVYPLSSLPEGILDGLSELNHLILGLDGLTSLPENIFDDLGSVKHLELSLHHLSRFPEGIFDSLSSLEYLYLFNNSQESIPEGFFSGLNNLQELVLDLYSLTNLPQRIFDGLSHLEELNLNSRVSGLPQGVFDGLSSLKVLDLTNSDLFYLREGIFDGLNNLQDLRLTYNNLQGLPEGIFDGLTSLQLLSLSGNKLKGLPEGVFNELVNLKHLRMWSNDLTILPERIFDGLSSLQLLGLGDNDLTSLPVGIFDELTSLTELFLPSTLTSLPEGIFDGLSSLQVLRLPGANLTNLPEGVFNGLSGLKTLHLHGWKETSLLDRMFNDLSSLETLTWNIFPVTSLPEGIFDGLSSLTELGLFGPLNSPPEGIFGSLSNLKNLGLSYTSLSSLPKGIFSGLSRLEKLSLSDNNLITLPAGIFHALSNLKFLNLSFNSLASLPEGIFSGLSSLKFLDLSENNLTSLPDGIFDGVLDTLGGPDTQIGSNYPRKRTLFLGPKSGLSFASTRQIAREGNIVRVQVTLSPALPVALRVPYVISGGVTAEEYRNLSPSPSGGLLFRAGETSKEIVLPRLTNTSSRSRTVTFSLGTFNEIALRRSDGTGPDAHYLRADSLIYHVYGKTMHNLTILGSGLGEPDPITKQSLFVPVILSSEGLNNSLFTSELTLTNRSSEPSVLNYTYTAHHGEGSGTATDTLASGRQRIQPDAIGYLKNLGIPIPGSGKRIGTVRVEEVSGSSDIRVMVRTTTTVPEGHAGLAYPGISGDQGFQDEAVYLCGLRQNQQDRSNVAFQNMGVSEEGAITVRTTVFSGDASDSSPRDLGDITLEPGGFHQFTEVLKVLGSNSNGYVRVERVEGAAPFYAYGVINDQANSDGSFVFPVSQNSLAGATGQVLPVVLERPPFTSELTVTNFSHKENAVTFGLVADAIETEDHTANFELQLKAGEQHIIPNVIDWARQRTSDIELPGGLASALFAEVARGDMSGIVIGARTGSQGSVGRYGVFYNAVPFGQSFTEVAWVDALQQNEENRSNLALVNTGEVDDSPSEFNLEIYNGETGLLANTATGFRVPARHWYQIDGILGKYGMGTTQGYVRIEKISGNNPFLAYGVINDGGTRLERSDDGAYLPARK